MSPSSALIFAAGFGSRMGDLTKYIPKPMLLVAGRPLLDYALDLTDNINLKNVVVNTHYLSAHIENHLQEKKHITVVYETPVILETGGGLKNSLPVLGSDPVFTLNSDVIWTGNNPLKNLHDAWDPNYMDALLMLIPIEKAQGYKGVGDFYLNDQKKIQRRGDRSNAPYIYSGAQIIKTELLDKIDKTSFSINLLWDQMIETKRAYGIVHLGGWTDVGCKNSLEIVRKDLNRNV